MMAEDPLRCQSLPHMVTAEWDLLELLMTSMARTILNIFLLRVTGIGGAGLTAPWTSTTALSSEMSPRFPQDRWSTSDGSARETFACSTSATEIFGWMPAW